KGEFIRLLATRTITKFFAQESKVEPLKFQLLGLSDVKIGYRVRHGRENKPRFWRLDILAQFLKEHSVTAWEVQFAQDKAITSIKAIYLTFVLVVIGQSIALLLVLVNESS
ncbi:MAG: hypothetical protein HRT95_05635, partial [Moritella sp.]|uniref:hypothetical protein n=1 Tax=Moritella sp. TaxID=78556 RepID=UPI001DF77C29